MQIENWRKIGIINDAYNANPASMEAAVKTLAGIECSGERTAILGDMFELGRQSRRQHLQLGKQVARAGIDRLYLLGAQAKHVRQGAILGGMPADRIVIGKDHGDVAKLLKSHVRKGDWLLFKGSRGMKMEMVLDQIEKRARPRRIRLAVPSAVPAPHGLFRLQRVSLHHVSRRHGGADGAGGFVYSRSLG